MNEQAKLAIEQARSTKQPAALRKSVDKYAAKVLRFLFDRGDSMRTDILKTHQSTMNASELDAACQCLLDGGLIHVRVHKDGRPGRPSIVLSLTDLARAAMS